MSDFEPFDVKLAKREVEAAHSQRDIALRDLEAARAELAKVKADINWCMKQGIIADFICHSDPAPAAAPGYVERPHPSDSDLVAWLNKNARVTLGERSFTIAFDHGGVDDQAQIPTPYNLRDLIGVCMALRGEAAAEPQPATAPADEGQLALI